MVSNEQTEEYGDEYKRRNGINKDQTQKMREGCEVLANEDLRKTAGGRARSREELRRITNCSSVLVWGCQA